MTTTIKITELTDIGANLASSSLVPVVNMAGIPVTQKTNIGNIANVILVGAGVDYPEATVALIAQTVSNAAQPNITSVGTLTNVTVSGNASINGNITANGTAYVGNLSTTGIASITTLSVGTTANLGAVGNVKITGGVSGYVLQTDGAGNLTWTAQTGGGGNGVPGGSNTQVQFNNAGSFGGEADFTYDFANNILNVIRANASYLTAYESVSTANLSANGLATIERINVTNTANLGAVGNVTITGGANGQVLTTNGSGGLSWTTVSGGGGANTGNVTFDDINIIGTGNLHLQPDPANSGSYLDIFLTSGPDLHLVASASANLILGEDDGANVMTSWNGDVAIQSWDTGTNTQGGVWTFDSTGNLQTAGDIVGPASANFTLYANGGVHEFIFADDGTFYAPDNVVLGGNAIYIGPGANTLTGTEHAVLIASSNHFAYIQGVINNVSDNGSADWVAQGHLGSDDGGWADIGFTSDGFGDANYTITGQGDGYVFAQSYYSGQAPGGRGGNLVLATGENGTDNDIIFGTGGFLIANIFGRISNSNNSFELSRTGATIKFPDNTVQSTAYTGEASFSIQNTNFSANAGGRYGVNTSGGVVTSTLPVSPATGVAIFFADAGGAYSTNNLIINPNGQTIMGNSGNMNVSTNNQSFGLFYNGTTWRTYN